MTNVARDWNSIAVERQTCPQCGSRPGRPCRTTSGDERTIPHRRRTIYAHITCDILSVFCRTCEASPYENCCTTNGRDREPHAPRIAAAARSA